MEMPISAFGIPWYELEDWLAAEREIDALLARDR